MSKPVARAADSLYHGGAIMTGATNVFSNTMPVARRGDIVVCKQHGLGAVGEHSSTVYACGKPVARTGDGCTCDGTGMIAGPGAQEIVTVLLSAHGEMTQEQLLERLKGHSYHAESVMSDLNQDGIYDAVGVRGALGRGQVSGAAGDFGFQLGGFDAKGSAVAGPGYGVVSVPGVGDVPFNYSTSLQGEVSAVQVGGNINVGGGSVGGEFELFSASVSEEMLIGNDGRLTGVILDGEVGASALSGEVTGVANTTVGEFIDRLSGLPLSGVLTLGSKIAGLGSTGYAEALKRPVTIEAKIGGSAGSVGGGGGVKAYRDNATGKCTIGGRGAVEALLGLDVSLSVTTDCKPVEAPNPISAGSDNVRVGD